MDTSSAYSDWWCVCNDSREGPVSVQELHRLLTNGTLGPQSLLWRQGMDTWQSAGQIQELAPLFASIPHEAPSSQSPPQETEPTNFREKYYEAKALLRQVQQELQDPNLSPAQRGALELHAARLSGFLLSPWVPVPWANRLTMVAIFLIGLVGAVTGNNMLMLSWLLLPFFSPSLMGEATNLAGRLHGRLERD